MTPVLVLLALAHASPRLDDPVRPVALDVAVTVDPAADTFTGRAEIALDVTARVTSFHLHGEELEIVEATLHRGRKPVPVAVAAVDGGRLSVVAEKPLRPGRHTLAIAYVGPVHDQPYGLYRFVDGDAAYLVTQLEADDARTVWPSFDEPSFKVPFTLAVTAPAGLAVVSNAPAAEVVEADGQQTVRFEPTPPIPTYAAALAVGPYEAVPVEGLGVPSRIWVPRGTAAGTPGTVEELPGVVAVLADWFGEPYPYAKLDLIVATDFAYGAMENPGAIVITQQVLVPPGRETTDDRHVLVEILAHEVGHQWFGNLVTMAWWDDFWLNESFAEWIAGRALHTLHPELRQDILEVRETQGIIGSDGLASARPLRTEIDPSAVFETANFAVYPKGEALLTMVEAWIGPDAFRDGVRAYLDTHRWGNATSADLFAALSAAGGVDVGPVMEGFLDQPGAPLLVFDLAGGGTATQSRYAALGSGELPFTPWTIPLHLRVGRADGSSATADVLLDDASGALGLGEAAWLLPTAGGVGYFAWDQSDAGWEALLAAAPGLEAREQVAILGDARLLVGAGRRDAAWALGLAARFGGATDPEVVRAALGLADLVSVAEHLDDEALEDLAHAWTRSTLTPWLEAIGRQAQDGEDASTTTLRRRLLADLARAEDESARTLARTLAEAWLADPSAVDPELSAWAMGVWVEDAPPEAQEMLLERAASAPDVSLRSQFLAWAGAVRGEAATERALALALDTETPLAETFSLLGGVGAAHEDDEAFLSGWVIANYDAVAAKLPPQFRMYLAGVGGGCDLARFEETRAFFLDPIRAVPGTERVLGETEARVRACVARREAYGASVRAFLAP